VGVIARDSELAVIETFLDLKTAGARALVLEGAAGIGKSTLWLAGVAAARDRSYRVLASRPAETERTLPNVVLGDLFGEVEPGVLATLSTPRRRAFESALLLREVPDHPVDPRALGVAILTLLQELAGSQRLVIAIDDDQWLDASSAATLEFALRRLRDEPIRLLLARRSGTVPSTTLEAAIDPPAVEHVAVGALGLEDVQQLLRSHVGISFPRPTLARIHEVSGGNPFYAIELARIQSTEPARDATLPLTVPPSLERLVGARLNTLDEPARRALLVVAAHGRLPDALARAMQVAPEAIERARAANVIESEGGIVRFAHPLLASALYQEATDDERRDTHRRLAEVVADRVHQARHLALGADAPDDDLAAALESAAGVARDRGLPVAAAELAEHAVRLTPPAAAGDRHRRAMAAARMHQAAGEGNRARAVAVTLEAEAPAGRRRAEALMLRAELERPAVGLTMLEEALTEASGVPELQAAIHRALADAGFFSSLRDFAWSERHARAALRLAERLQDDGLRANALGILAVLRFSGCDPLALALAEQAYQLGTETGDATNAVRAIWPMALVLTWQGRTDSARAWLERRLGEWRDRDERVRSDLGWYLAIVEVMAGRWDVASAYVNEVEEISIEYEAGAPYDRFPTAFLAMHRGEIEIARERSRSALGLGLGALLEFFYGTLAMCDAWSGSPSAALENFALAERAADAIGEDEPSMRFWRADHVEALIQVGRIEDATVLLADWESKAEEVGRERVIAQAMRCRGLIAVARGDLLGGAGMIEAAIDMHQTAGDPFGRARTLLALGMARRRLRQKRTARQAMEAALAGFVALGALGWAATARVELARIGGRQRLEGLSPSELGVATLAAEGRTNREIAAALFLGERTVAGHLTHIYSKLGVRSRTELAGTLRREPEISAGDAGKVATS
jgi:DNA-binding CsgD family transcriptional regulator